MYGGGTWNAQNTIVFAPTMVGPLLRIAPTGGETKAVTQVQTSQIGHVFPHFLPNGQHCLHGVGAKTASAYLGSLDSSDTRQLTAADFGGIVYASGQLLFIRQAVLLAQDFDVQSFQ